MTASGARRISPGVVFLAIALIGSVVFVAVRHHRPRRVADPVAGGRRRGPRDRLPRARPVLAARRPGGPGIDGRNGRALGLGVGGGIAAIIGAGCLAGAVILFLLSPAGLRRPDRAREALW